MTERAVIPPTVLVIDDDEAICNLAAEDLAGHASRVLIAGDLAAGVARAREGSPDVILLDVRLPRRPGQPAVDCGLDAIAELRAASGGATVIVLSSHDSAALGIRALRQGAADFIAKPYAAEHLVAAVTRAMKDVHQSRELEYLRGQVDELLGAGFFVGETAAMRQVLASIDAAAPTDATVLVTGETGTGKELVARAIHQRSPRRGEPFVAVNVGAIPRELLESTLFGHERGAFTGAAQGQPGRLEIAGAGTLFFDEIGELEPALQVKLLRVLQEGSYERVGGHRTLRLQARVVAATNRDLAAEAQAGRFRRDLYYRLNVIPITVPPLRERIDDLPALVELFVARYAQRYCRGVPGVDAGAVRELMRHDWPGNIRELEHLVQRLVVLARPGDKIGVDDLPLEYRYGALLAAPAPALEAEAVLRNAIAAFERDFVLKTLARCGGNRTRAARLLGIHPATLFRKLGQYGRD